MNTEYFRLAFVHLRHRPTRTFLTLIGIFIGIAAVVALVSLGRGLQEAIDEQFRALGTDKLMIMPGAQAIGFAGAALAPVELTDEDVETVRRTEGIDLAAPMITKVSLIGFGRENKGTFVIGIPLDPKSRKIIEEMSSIRIARGRWLREGDRYRVVVGYLLAKEKGFFAKPVKVGDKIIIQKKEFQVIGALESVGNPQDDEQVYIPIEIAKEIFDTSGYFLIYAQTRPGLDTAKVAEAVKKELRRAHGVKEGQEDFTVQTLEQLRSTFMSLFFIVQVIVVGIAGISLLVGGIGIMNTMYAAVLERTREIGIMKAVGARNGDVLLIFLIESGLLGLVGGAIGVGIGVALSKAVEYAAAQALRAQMLRAWITPELILGTLLFSFLVGAVSGALPARQAALLKPVEALRYE